MPSEGLALEANDAADDDGDDELLLEANGDSEDDDSLLLEANGDSEDDDSLLLEANGDYDDGEDALLLEDNTEPSRGDAAAADDDDDSVGLQLEDNEVGDEDGDAVQFEQNARPLPPTQLLPTQPPPPQPPPPPPPPCFDIGAPVRVCGLKARPELNGRSGRVASGSSPQGRLGVQVEGVVAPLALRADNLEAAPAPPDEINGHAWRATPSAAAEAARSLAALVEGPSDARFDEYTLPRGLLPPSEVGACEEHAKSWIEKIAGAHADPAGRTVASELGLLDAIDCGLSTSSVRARLRRRFLYKELGMALFRANRTREAHRACCAAARAAHTWRELYAKWVMYLVNADERALAGAVSALGVRRGAFQLAMQRPASTFVPSLAINGWRGPWYDASTIPAAQVLLANYEAIRSEYRKLIASLQGGGGGGGGGDGGDGKARAAAGGSSRHGKRSKGAPTGQQEARASGFESYPSPAVERGEWSDFMLVHGGQVDASHIGRFPTLERLLCAPDAPLRADAAAMVAGSSFFSRMKPGTHLRAHCGPTNLRLRVHLGIDVPAAASDGRWRLRVGDEVREWREGECLVFDDSYEHEVWHEPPPEGEEWSSSSPSRVVLIVDIWHPAIPPHERRSLLGGGKEATTYEQIVRGRRPLEAMNERQLSDGSIRLIRGD